MVQGSWIALSNSCKIYIFSWINLYISHVIEIFMWSMPTSLKIYVLGWRLGHASKVRGEGGALINGAEASANSFHAVLIGIMLKIEIFEGDLPPISPSVPELMFMDISSDECWLFVSFQGIKFMANFHIGREPTYLESIERFYTISLGWCQLRGDHGRIWTWSDPGGGGTAHSCQFLL